jgi:osmotically-inducible protein OsmY
MGSGAGSRQGGSYVDQSTHEGGLYRGKGPKGYQRSDERIREDVCERLEDHPELDASEIEVQVSKGEVTLKGGVSDRRQKRMAEDCAEGVSGVKEVSNQIRIQRGDSQQQGDTGSSAAKRQETSRAGARS